MSYNGDISTKYNKWIIRLFIDEKPYYTVWGYDNTTWDKDNKVLVDENAKMLLFTTITSLIKHLKNSNLLFDKRSLTTWAKKLKSPIRSHSTYNIDLLKNKELSISTQKDFNELIGAFDIPDDYAHCTNDKKMLSIVLSPQLRNLFDYHCNLYLWSRDENRLKVNERKLNPDKVITLLNKLYIQFFEKIVIIK